MHLFWTHFHGYALKFSPFAASGDSAALTGSHGAAGVAGSAAGDVLAVATSQYYGVAGNGRLYVVALDARAGFRQLAAFTSAEAMYDCAWNELCERQIVTGCGDGSIKLWDVAAPDGFPVASWGGHTGEVAAVAWNTVSKRLCLSASWDGSVKIWDANAMAGRGAASGQAPAITSLPASHGGAAAYAAEWHPRHDRLVASAGGDHRVVLWDINGSLHTFSRI